VFRCSSFGGRKQLADEQLSVGQHHVVRAIERDGPINIHGRAIGTLIDVAATGAVWSAASFDVRIEVVAPRLRR
jgi:hypothetical protein